MPCLCTVAFVLLLTVSSQNIIFQSGLKTSSFSYLSFQSSYRAVISHNNSQIEISQSAFHLRSLKSGLIFLYFYIEAFMTYDFIDLNNCIEYYVHYFCYCCRTVLLPLNVHCIFSCSQPFPSFPKLLVCFLSL